MTPLTSFRADLNSPEWQDAFAVPAGKRFVPTGLVLRDPSANLYAVDIVMDAADSYSGDYLVESHDLSALEATNTSHKCLPLVLRPVLPVISAGDRLQIRFNREMGEGSGVTIDVFGYLVDE
jgi:hypothetical protein